MDDRHGAGSSRRSYRGRLAVVLVATCTILGLEVVGALVSGSLVLLAEAGRTATDAAGIGLLLLLLWLVARPATPEQAFGYYRLQLLAACVSAVLLFGVGGYVLVEAVRRLLHPAEVAGGILLVFGAVALAGNGCWLWLLRHGQVERRNVDAGLREVVIDLVGVAAVLVTAGIIRLTGFTRADPIAALPIGLLLLCRTWTLLRRTVDVLLEVSPKGINLAEVRRQMLGQPGVVDVHDLHAWTMTSGSPVLAAHVVVADDANHGQVLDWLGELLADHFDIEHSSFQLEPVDHQHHEPNPAWLHRRTPGATHRS
jgi:cobalt-zinc-cadmium efflux system protein